MHTIIVIIFTNLIKISYYQKMHPHKKLHLGYWKARGKGEVARQMMALCGQDWDEKHYTGNGEEWFGKDKK